MPYSITADKIAWMKELKSERRGRISEYVEEYSRATYHEGEAPWRVDCDIAMPCATQNELDESDAKALVDKDVMAVCEGANMPTTMQGMKVFQDAEILYAPGKAANAGGVAVSGLEMSQNSERVSWNREKLDDMLTELMEDIHGKCVEHGRSGDNGHVNYAKGANIAGFEKVAEEMLAFGVV